MQVQILTSKLQDISSWFATKAPSNLLGVPARTHFDAQIGDAMDAHVQRCARFGFRTSTNFIDAVPGRITTFLLGAPKNLQFPVVFRVNQTTFNADANRPTPRAADAAPRTSAQPLLWVEFGYQALAEACQNEGVVGLSFSALHKVFSELGALVGAAVGLLVYTYKGYTGHDNSTTIKNAARLGKDIAATVGTLVMHLPCKALDLSRAIVCNGYGTIASLGGCLGAAVGAASALPLAAWIIAKNVAGLKPIARILDAVGVGLLCGTALGAVAGTTAATLVCLQLVFSGTATAGVVISSSLCAGYITGAIVGCVMGLASAQHHFSVWDDGRAQS